MILWAWLLAAPALASQPEDHLAAPGPAPSLARWPSRDARPRARQPRGRTRAGLEPLDYQRRGEVFIFEGNEEGISGLDDQLGLRFDEERNDLATLTRRAAQSGLDGPGLLVLFTTFDDRGAGGPAYFVPFFNETKGTGLGPLDQREAFGVQALEGLINMKRLESHDEAELIGIFIHEIAHRHLAYFTSFTPSGSTTAVSLLGRQGAHWRAAMHTQGSLLGGHDWLQIEPGCFVAHASNTGLSSLDLYALGLLPAAEVPPAFIIAAPTLASGAAHPQDAILQPGAVVRGARIDVPLDALVAEHGPRAIDPEPLQLTFVLLTRPGESATDARATADKLDALRLRITEAWSDPTQGLGALRTERCAPLDCEAPEGCECAHIGPRADARLGALSAWLCLLLTGLLFLKWAASAGPGNTERRGRAPAGSRPRFSDR